MAERPHDVTDLYLAPVVLEAESRLEQLGTLSPDEFGFQVTLETNIEPGNAAERRTAFLETMRRRVELHGWELSLRRPRDRARPAGERPGVRRRLTDRRLRVPPQPRASRRSLC